MALAAATLLLGAATFGCRAGAEEADVDGRRPTVVDTAFGRAVAAYDAGDYATAAREWRVLAERGDPAAMRNLGHLYRFGRGVPKDLAAAAAWYRRAAELGFDRAQANLASLYMTGEGVPLDQRKAAEWFEQAARQGHVVAQYNLGLLYEHGLGVPRNEAKSLGWYNLAARGGHPKALEKLSEMVMQPPPEDEAVAADPAAAPPPQPSPPKLPPAPRREVPLLAEARPTPAAAPQALPPQPSPPDADRAADTAAAVAESPSGTSAPTDRDIGDRLWSLLTSTFGSGAGSEAPRDAADGERTAASRPQPAAAPRTATPPQQAPARPAADAPVPGDPVREGLRDSQAGDHQAALAHWLPAAQAGDARAAFYMGRAYRQGAGVPTDKVRAHMWWSLAARQGHPEARAALAALQPEMTASEIAEAEALAAATPVR